MKKLVALYRAGKLKKASSRARKLLLRDPSDVQILTILGGIQLAQGAHAEAVSTLRRVAARNSNDADSHFNLGVALKETGQLQAAEKSYRKAIQCNPKFAEAYMNLGNVFLARGKPERAIEQYDRALQLKPNDAALYNNRGNAYRRLTELEHAISNYQQAIELSPHFVEAHNNFGLVLLDQGRLDQARASFERVTSIDPDHADALCNLGVVAVAEGKSDDAIAYFEGSIEKNPRHSRAYVRLGKALQVASRFYDAAAVFERGIALWPDNADFHFRLGIVQSEAGNIDAALLSYQNALGCDNNHAGALINAAVILGSRGESAVAELNYRRVQSGDEGIKATANLAAMCRQQGRVAEAYRLYSDLLSRGAGEPWVTEPLCFLLAEHRVSFEQLDRSAYRSTLIDLLRLNTISHASIARNIATFGSDLPGATADLLDQPSLSQQSIDELARDELVNLSLSKVVVPDPAWETYFAALRLYFCRTLGTAREATSERTKRLLIALAQQCFLNEYVFVESDEERSLVATLESRIFNSARIDEVQVALLACYRPLWSIDRLSSRLRSRSQPSPMLENLIKEQVTQPFLEWAIRADIPGIGQPANETSNRVKHQYEANPYPRWKFAFHPPARSSTAVAVVNKEISPNCVCKQPSCASAEHANRPIEVLIAGCGTGRQVIHAQRYENANILAIDLSIASLSYAIRKTDELGIGNVEYLHADILDLARLERTFDLIECSGVLHHMEEPHVGLSQLVSKLRPAGFLKLGLYSETARGPTINATKKMFAGEKVDASPNGIRGLRQRILSTGANPLMLSLLESPDFYTTSSCRDLILHVQEHRLTLQDVSEMLEANGLEFLGFLLPKAVKDAYAIRTPSDPAMTSLHGWDQFEQRQPRTFDRMYQFWAQKAH